MPARVTLVVTRGKLQGQEFVFPDRTTCIMGRADDCSPRLPDDKDHKTISRHHCLLDVNPPDIRIRDFGSRNGTFVNGKKIGQRAEGQTPEEGARIVFPEFDLKHGDEIELGDTTFRVGVLAPAVCADCSADLPEGRKVAAELESVVLLCEACVKNWARRSETPPPRPRKACAQCGKDVAGEMGEHRHGEFICAGCKSDPARIVQHLLDLSERGDEGLRALRGYRILRELGRGGNGAVYLVRRDHTGEQIALKVMLPRVAADEHARQLFLREAENTKALNHPNVVRLYESACHQGVFFFALEYCDGGSAEGPVKERGPLPLAEAAPIVLQALVGLEYAHNVFGPGKGLVHRDLKPHNLFLSGPSSVAKVGDYGLAKAFDLAGLSGQTRTGAVAGSPAFMPRQQVINFKYAKPEVDVWATAASFYYLLTGGIPRDFPPGMDRWLAVLQTDPVPIRRRNASLPKKLAEVIDLALVDKPAIHFKTAAELKQALEAALA
jgi:serine/threonine-protein kinase